MNKKILIVGAGGHGRSVAELIQLTGEYSVFGFVDDAASSEDSVSGFPILGTIEQAPLFRKEVAFATVALGNNLLRQTVSKQLIGAGFSLATVIHPKAIISPSASIGSGTAIMAGAIVGTEATLGEGVIVNCGAVVDHHCHVDEFAHLGVNAAMAGGSRLGRLSWMQAGAALGYGVNVAAERVLFPGEALS